MSLWGIVCDSNAGVFINVHCCALVVITALGKKDSPLLVLLHILMGEKYFLKARIMITSEQR